MKIVVEMPWARNLSVNHCNMGPQGNWHLRPGAEAWKDRLGWETYAGNWHLGIPTTKGGQINVKVDFRFPNRHKRDDHNYHYLIANGVAAGLHIDDKDIRISTGSVIVDRKKPGFTITIEAEGETE